MDFGLLQLWNAISRAQRAILVGIRKTKTQREMQIVEGGPAHKAAKGNKDSPRSQARGHSSFILAESNFLLPVLWEVE